MVLSVAAETPLQDEIREMVAKLNAHLRPLSPPEFQYQLTVEQMAGADATVFVARDETGTAVAMGSLKVHDAETGEVKRMYAEPHLRGRGLGRAILTAIEAKARGLGLTRLVLETGATPGFEPAWTLYERGGFRRCDAVLDYPPSDYSRFYEKSL
ncbi:GNAT family N-acetyltransferase [Aurantimonas sp. 22II-16-19i]|uniref:GNAT family N-acetyltransferase n=1 Tax=Aurantimonas sp. 22II-16-19i TaxID=1317114 RepID=UPI0009F7D178|nr:GNAT family N-acetyltransferase [Aurantimonas sp. 22II-16-19i]ORE92767.1 histone acetyltransferase HPA2-related acetyltransferase [Aurantimonas sp. 22II-16-19i]